ncbi:MAG: peptide deformylase [Candidatus Shapirobacteria bacterium]|nr:peptide deformylase [Candidatus Shapirobacteria bacterium]
MKIITAPNPILRKSSVPIAKIDNQTKGLVNQLINSLIDGGIGLAAPQIGQNKTIFIINLPQKKPQIFINPVIVSHSPKKQYFTITDAEEDNHHHGQVQPFLEGCLSLPKFYGTVRRWPKISAQWLDLDGKKRQKNLTGLGAIVFQHELDHLKGKLFPERIIKQDGQLYREEKNGQLKEISPQDIFNRL